MKIGIIGLGHLGMPVALAMDLKGHDVMGYDIDQSKMVLDYPHAEQGPSGEPSIVPFLKESGIRFGSLEEVVDHAEIIFVVVQTSHAPKYEGITRLPEERRDFDYSHLKVAVEDIAACVEDDKILAIISTCLPGTIDREVKPLVSPCLHLAHTPFLEAMGTVVSDFMNREFVLIGTEDKRAAEKLGWFFATVTDAPQVVASIADVEAIKVYYNVFITSKICFANAVMEACHKYGGNCDVVLGTLQTATQRLISPRYLSGGMGDGGMCHPRDCIALSHFAQKHNMSFDLFGMLMKAREKQAEWLCELLCESDLPKFILGTAFKARSNIEAGSAVILCKNILEEWGHDVETWDPYVDGGECPLEGPHAVLVGMNHPEFEGFKFPEGCYVVDPWGITGTGVGRAG